MKTAEYFYYGTALVLWFFIIRNYVITRRLKKRANKAIEDNKEAVEIYMQVVNERVNLLAKENVKVRQRNEFLEEKLRDLGIKNIDL